MIQIDLKAREVVLDGGARRLPFASPEAFELVSEIWVQAGWDVKYPYTFSWFGRPVIQIPEDLVRVQEAIYAVRPDIVLETGIAHGGSLVFSASLLKAMGNGRVIGVDIEIRPHNRAALEAHELKSMITLVEGSSIEPTIVAHVHALVEPGAKVLLILDSKHTREHVLAELEAYSDLVPVGSYIIAEDGIMRDVVGAPRTESNWVHDNPVGAVDDFLAKHPEFERARMTWPFNESEGLTQPITYFRDGWLRRVG